MKRILCSAVLLIALAVQLPAANILVFEDFALGTSVIPGALALSGQCGICTITTDSGSFNTALTGGGWDIVIYAEQDGSTFGASAAELAAYMAGGGMMIGQTWLTGGLDALLEASANSTNGTSITTDGDVIFTGVGGTITLSNPGWGVFSRGWDPVGTAVGLGSLSSGGFAVIRGNGGRSYLNAPLTDTYATLGQGELLLANEINALVNASVPEPASMGLVGLGLTAVALIRRRK